MIAPAAGTIAPFIDDQADQDALGEESVVAENYMAIANFSGYPSLTQPMGFVDGCPVGVNITCRGFAEVEMFNIAKAIEEETGLRDLVAEVK